MGGTLFPKEIFLTSERWARQRFPGMVYWNEVPQGGHFAALEQPEVFATELRNCFRRMR
jgi:pimeloyl-ACP methyl ester carboxylesterase